MTSDLAPLAKVQTADLMTKSQLAPVLETVFASGHVHGYLSRFSDGHDFGDKDAAVKGFIEYINSKTINQHEDERPLFAPKPVTYRSRSDVVNLSNPPQRGPAR